MRTGYFLGMAASAFYPHLAISKDPVARAHELQAREDLDPSIRRELVDGTWDLERRLAIKKTFRSRP